MIIEGMVMVSLNLEDYGVTPCSTTVYARELKKGFSVYLDADKELLAKPIWIGSTKKDYDWNTFGRILCQIKEGVNRVFTVPDD
jgi:hypothetical protein